MFVLAHLSDPHLAPLPAPHWHELTNKRITGYINWRRRRRFAHERAVLNALIADLKAQKPDHIAVAGDLANIALPEEFTRGRAWLESLGAPKDVSMILGNHDMYVAQAAPIAMRDWGGYMTGDDGEAGFPYLRRRGNVALIGLSSGVPSAPFLATGRLGEHQLAALSEMLESLSHENIFRVVMIHHPPVSLAARHKLLVDAPALKDVIAAHGAELLLHGHDHLHMLNWLEGPKSTRVPAVGVPSASAAPHNAKNVAAYNLYAIDGAPGRWQCDMISRGFSERGIIEQQRMKLID